jgi:autotransporter translocation and assembly factor TamB
MPNFGAKIVPAGDRFDIDPDQSTGLSLRVRGGIYIHASLGGFRNAPNGTLTLAASSINYVELTAAGVISVNQSGFTDGRTQLYLVTTNATVVTDVADCRANAGVANAQILI